MMRVGPENLGDLLVLDVSSSMLYSTDEDDDHDTICLVRKGQTGTVLKISDRSPNRIRVLLGDGKMGWSIPIWWKKV